jgi:hypothetical protein
LTAPIEGEMFGKPYKAPCTLESILMLYVDAAFFFILSWYLDNIITVIL